METLRFVLHHHHRGKNIHSDLRLEKENHLIGLTLDDPGSVYEKAKFSNDAKYSSENKILTQMNKIQPREWLNVEGEIPPGENGAGRDEPSKFEIIDSGIYEMGAQTHNLFEFFLKGNKFNGRFISMQLLRQNEKVWFTWKPLDQNPYVLSKKNMDEKFVPPKSVSALSREWKDKIPQEIRWYEKGFEGEKAIGMIREIRELFIRRHAFFSEENGIKGGQNLSDHQIKMISILSKKSDFSIGNIAKEVGCSKSTVNYNLRKLGLK